MALQYEDGFIPEKPHFLYINHLKTQEFLKPFIGKIVKDIKYPEGYSTLLIIFEDGAELEVDAEDCFDFRVNGV